MESKGRASLVRRFAVAASVGFLLSACSVALDRGDTQCSTDSDCTKFGGHPRCQAGLCVASGLGPEGCFLGTPNSNEQFLNQCSTSKCEAFDNCARLGLCNGAPAPEATTPQVVSPPAPNPVPPATQPCVVAGKNTVVVTGSTALQPFLAVVAGVLANSSPPYQIAYQGNGSCNGVENIFNTDSNRRIIRDSTTRANLLFEGTKAPVACTFEAAGAPVDVAISDVFSSSCNPAYLPGSTIADYPGPIQPMTFVTPAASSERVLSAELGRFVFGRGGKDAQAMPYANSSLFFVRNNGSGTQQMMARAIGVSASRWWGVDTGGSSGVRSSLLAVPPGQASGSIGILSTDISDKERENLRIMAFQSSSQLCGYYPDSTPFTRDKINVRDGHYSIWGPIHLYAAISGGIPSQAAQALITPFTKASLDQSLLDAIIKSGLVPQCAMKVQRSEEMGAVKAYSAPFQCHCYFEANVPQGTVSADCTTCGGPADCPADRPACNLGYCEKQ